jgi:hypothetical protein
LDPSEAASGVSIGGESYVTPQINNKNSPINKCDFISLITSTDTPSTSLNFHDPQRTGIGVNYFFLFMGDALLITVISILLQHA